MLMFYYHILLNIIQKMEEPNAVSPDHQINAFTQDIIEPAFSRPVPPTLLKVYADNQDKKTLCCFWLIFFFIILLISIVSMALPKELLEKTNFEELKGTTLQGCSNPNRFVKKQQNQILECTTNATQTKVGVILRKLTKLNQFAVIFLDFQLLNIQKSININETVEIQVIKLAEISNSQNRIEFKNVSSLKTYHQTQLYLHSEESIQIREDNETTIGDHETTIGYRYPIFVDQQLQVTDTLVLITFEDKAQLENINMRTISASLLVVNPEFTKYTFAIRYIFFGLSLIVLGLYACRYRRVPRSAKIIQQKLVLVLCVLLIFFNDPFYPITILSPNPISSYLSVFFVVNFVMFLLFFWIIFLDRIYFEDGEKATNLLNWKRILFIAISYVLTFILYVQYALDNVEGLPIVPTQDLFSTRFIVLQSFVLITILCAFIYITYRYVKICMKIEQKLWRSQMFIFFSLFFLFTTMVLFIINGFTIHSYHGNRVLLLYTQMNMYAFYMGYMYTVTGQDMEKIDKGQLNEEGMLTEENKPKEPDQLFKIEKKENS